MDSKAVNLAIRGEVRPLLSGAGFGRSSARTFWRYHPDRVDVVNFQSFNSYNAGVLGVTTFSFAVNLGCFLRYVPNQYPNLSDSRRLSGERPQPKEYDCQLRGRLTRSYPDRGCSNMQIWFIDERGSNVQKALHDVCMTLSRVGLPWFEQFTSPTVVCEILAGREEEMGRLWGFGRPGSPIRTYFLGYAAKAAGMHDVARANLVHAAGTKSFESIRDRILSDAERAV
jgi:hypothetical protein